MDGRHGVPFLSYIPSPQLRILTQPTDGLRYQSAIMDGRRGVPFLSYIPSPQLRILTQPTDGLRYQSAIMDGRRGVPFLSYIPSPQLRILTQPTDGLRYQSAIMDGRRGVPFLSYIPSPQLRILTQPMDGLRYQSAIVLYKLNSRLDTHVLLTDGRQARCTILVLHTVATATYIDTADGRAPISICYCPLYIKLTTRYPRLTHRWTAGAVYHSYPTYRRHSHVYWHSRRTGSDISLLFRGDLIGVNGGGRTECKSSPVWVGPGLSDGGLGK
ncbi:hypothetical protein J6590_005758 [Homalodisca vitripennis]|nr:hypothetical protein J6590_005758 [Homalodisca vitripennis]